MSKRISQSEFVALAILVHGDRYDYSKVQYLNKRTKVVIICRKHGEFCQSPLRHLSGQGCTACKYEKISNSLKLSQHEFIERARLLHNDFYDYSKVKYDGQLIPVLIICPKHGEFNQTPKSHMRGAGCLRCGYDRVAACNSSNAAMFVDAAQVLFCNTYSYGLVEYIANNKPVKIICRKHGIFSMLPNSHLSGQGCPVCRESIGERTIRIFLTKHGIDFVPQKKFDNLRGSAKKSAKRLPFDFFIPTKNLLIEYDGRQHYAPVGFFGGVDSFTKTQRMDHLKTEYCRANNISLLRIRYSCNFRRKT